MNGRERVLAMIEGREVDCLPCMPIAMMFAADFVGVPYGKYALDYRVLVDAQVRMAEAFDVDAVTVMSDPAREAADCGVAVKYFDNQPPALDELQARLADKSDLLSLPIPDPLGGGRMHDRINGVALLKERVGTEKLLVGWFEGPLTMAAHLRGINAIMTDFYEDPQFVCDLFEFVVEMQLRFGRVQLEAGADIMGLCDPTASLVGPDIYNEYIWPYQKRIVDGIHALGGRMRLHMCGHTGPILSGMGRLGCEIVDLDWPAPPDVAREIMGPDQVLLGNIDPVSSLRAGTPASVTADIADCHAKAGERYIVSAGCEVVRDTPHDNIRALHDYARSHGGQAGMSR